MDRKKLKLPLRASSNMLDGYENIVDADGNRIGKIGNFGDDMAAAMDYATAFVRACNSFDALLAACEAALSHIEELRDAWMTGSINERDGKGGTRSNRNVEVESCLRAAIKLAKGEAE